MLPSELAAQLELLLPVITPTVWRIHSGDYNLTIRPEKNVIEMVNGKRLRRTKCVCSLATKGTERTLTRVANAKFICLMQNHKEMIIDALKHSTRAGHGK